MTFKLRSPKFQISTSAQREICRALGNIGVMRWSNAENVFRYDALRDLSDMRMIETRKTIINGKVENIINLTKKGKDYTRRYLVYGSLYKRSGYQVGHDLALSEIYLKCSQKERKTWLNDAAVKGYIAGRFGGNYEAIDGGYIDKNGEFVGVEIFTSSYTQSDIQAKNRTLAECCGRAVTGRE